MTVANVKSQWVGGDLYFYDKNGGEIAHWDGTNRKLVVPNGSALEVDGVTVDGDTLAMDGVTASADEINVLDGVVAGTATASKALVVGANKNLDTLAIADSGLKLGAGAGTAVTATAAELNKLDGAGAIVPSGTQVTEIAEVGITYTSNDPGITPNGAVTVADGSSPSVGELLELCEELLANQNAIIAALEAFGITASS